VEGPVHEPVFKYRLTVEYESKRIEGNCIAYTVIIFSNEEIGFVMMLND
jgi:hypothetical protein